MPSQSRQLAAIMFTDIVGYTALMGEDEQKAFEVLDQFKSIATPLVQKHNGKWHKDLGDGALCSFGSALDAVKSAIAIQQQLNKEIHSKIRNSGDVTFQDGDVFGDGVNIASRIQSEAAPGGICLSEAVYKTVRNKEGIKAAFLGKRKLKNVEGLTKLYQISAQGIETKGHTPVKVISLWKALILSVGLAVLLSVLWVRYFQSPGISQSKGVERYDIILPEETPLALIGSAPLGIGQTALAISPDGNLLVYAGQEDRTTRLFIRSIDIGEVDVLEGTEGAFSPFFSPDGKWIGFFSSNYLKKVSVRGGEPITLCAATNSEGGVWAYDYRIFFSDEFGARLNWIHAEGGERHELQVEGASGTYGSFNLPSLLGEKYILVSTSYPNGIVAISLESGQSVKLLDQGSDPHFIPSGYLSFVEHGRLMVVPFDLKTLTIKGKIVSIIDDLQTEEIAGQVSVSNDGTLIYVPGISAMESELVFRSIDGKEEVLSLKPDYYGPVNISPDGEKLAISNQNTGDIYVYDIRSQTITRLTHDGSSNQVIWTPNGTKITYGIHFDSLHNIFQINASGSDAPMEIISSNTRIYPIDWSSDGKVFMYGEYNPAASSDIKFHFFNQTREDLVLTPNRATQTLARFSPKNDYVAYTSNESGQFEVYVQPFPPNGDRRIVSTDGGEEPIWSPKGDKLYYRNVNGNNWMVVTCTLEPTFSAGVPELLFSGHYVNVLGYSYDISPDGQHFLLLRPVNNAQTASRLKVVKNLFEELNRLAPTD